MPNWSNVYDEFIAGLLLIMFTGIVAFVARYVFRLSLRKYVIGIAIEVVKRCPRIPILEIRRYLKDEGRKREGLDL